MKESWKPIRGTGGLYQVSSRGRIKSIGGRKGSKKRPTILKTNPHHLSGHHRVFFCINQVKSWRWVHRLVLEAFVGPKPHGKVSAHLDGDPGNNVVGNLKWVSLRENTKHRFEHANADFAKFTEREKRRIRQLYLKRMSPKEIAAKIGCRTDAIWRAIRPHTYPG